MGASRAESAPASGAWRRWAGLAACGALFLVAYVHRFAVGTLGAALMAEFGATAVQVGGLASLYFYLYGAMQLPSGIMADSLGPRRTLLLSGVCLAAGAGLSAWAPALPAAYLGRVLVGLGAGPILVSAIRLIATWFDPWWFATLVGLISLAGNLGGFLAGAPLAAAAAAVGWRGVFWGLGALTLIVALVCWAAVRDRPAGSRGGAGGMTPGASLRAVAAALGDPEIRKALVAKAGLDSSYFVFFAAWGVPYLSQAYGISPVAASRFVSIAVVGFALGGPALGYVSDRLFRSRRVPLLLAATGYLLLWTFVFAPPGGSHGPALFGVAAFLMGFLVSGLLLTLSIARDVSPPQAAGVATALVNGAGFLGAAVFQVLASALLDLYWDGQTAGGARVYPARAFHAAFAACVGAILVSMVATLRMREAPRRREAAGPG
jgi:sugar phosphate permease